MPCCSGSEYNGTTGRENTIIHKNKQRASKQVIQLYSSKLQYDCKSKLLSMCSDPEVFYRKSLQYLYLGPKYLKLLVGTNCVNLSSNHLYEMELIQSLLSLGKKLLASQFNFTYRYMDDDLSINNPDFEDYLGQMYPPELKIKDTTESNTFASYLDLLLSIGRDSPLCISLYDKRDDFNSHITNFPFLSSNILSSPAYGIFISQLIRYDRACFSYECFILRAVRLSSKLLGQGYVYGRLQSSLRKFYGRYGDLTK